MPGIIAILFFILSVFANVPTKVTSDFETYWAVSLNRDCGFSHSLPNNQNLWLFCDTAWKDLSGQHFVPGSTAAIGPATRGEVPGSLVELPTPSQGPRNQPHAGPAQFLPNPTGLFTPNGQPCTANGGQYPASWITGVTGLGADNLLITYTDLCVTQTATPFFIQRFGIAEYTPSTNTFSARTTIMANPGVHLPAAKILGSPVITTGYLYLYGYECTGWFSGVCTAGNTFAARVPTAQQAWRSAGNYQWDTAAGWTGNFVEARNVLPSAAAAVSVHDFGGQGVNAILQKDLGGGFEIWRAPSPAGPWTNRSTGKVGCSGGTGHDLCRALTGHPGLSTTTDLMLSYFNPASSHVEATTIPWS